MVTPLLGWRADSRPCDCAQESEDCITACGERPQEWTEKGGENSRERERERERKKERDARGVDEGEEEERRMTDNEDTA